MPPLRFKAPLPVAFKVPKGRIVPLENPDIRLGKSLIASAPYRITATQLELTKKLLKKHLGKQHELLMNVHATYAVCRKADGTKQGQGKGAIHHYVARVPAGRTLFQIPTMNPFESFDSRKPFFKAFSRVIGQLPVPCHFRAQYNHFPMDSVLTTTKQRLSEQRLKKKIDLRTKLMAT